MVLGIRIDPSNRKPTFPKWTRPWIWKLSDKVAKVLLDYMKKNKTILREEYIKSQNKYQ